jgi:cytidine deaminase
MSNPLITIAINAREKSYSPYSNRKVGAVIKLSNGKTYTGCNVENSSFGGTVCAERVAVWKAVSEEGPSIQIDEVVVATDATQPWSPCGLCRQIVNEFANPNCQVTLVNLTGTEVKHQFKALLPFGFDRSALQTN